ncbi:uncharacterized protein N7529_001661 [Penicillium soppii]|jgi:hypothetical protein|uniref:uncharacterized protein n=1 Tax=Penicillium soppii TaxID=69789 RepID=UPI0025472A83|nr:uncharacterized protein N7529_001661 [Penicillium soppii]KAJ5876077.1 hypothetical protein N7529_001661 [Penicillium soppii]
MLDSEKRRKLASNRSSQQELAQIAEQPELSILDSTFPVSAEEASTSQMSSSRQSLQQPPHEKMFKKHEKNDAEQNSLVECWLVGKE